MQIYLKDLINVRVIVYFFVILQRKKQNYILCNNNLTMELYFSGVIIAVSTFLAIGIFHPLVIKTEYYFGTRPWWMFLVAGIGLIIGALFIENVIISSIIGVIGASSLWSIGELFSQKRRVEKGWFPMNPKRKDEYEMVNGNEDENEACKK